MVFEDWSTANPLQFFADTQPLSTSLSQITTSSGTSITMHFQATTLGCTIFEDSRNRCRTLPVQLCGNLVHPSFLSGSVSPAQHSYIPFIAGTSSQKLSSKRLSFDYQCICVCLFFSFSFVCIPINFFRGFSPK